MKKLKMARGTTMTFEEGCNKYLEHCRQRNLRDGRYFKSLYFIHPILQLVNLFGEGWMCAKRYGNSSFIAKQ